MGGKWEVPGTDASLSWVCNDPQKSLLLFKLISLDDPIMPGE